MEVAIDKSRMIAIRSRGSGWTAVDLGIRSAPHTASPAAPKGAWVRISDWSS